MCKLLLASSARQETKQTSNPKPHEHKHKNIPIKQPPAHTSKVPPPQNPSKTRSTMSPPTPLIYQTQPATTMTPKATTECYNLGREPFSWTDSPSDLQAWQTRLSSPGAVFFTASSQDITTTPSTNPSEPSTSPSTPTSTIAAFLLALPRTHPELSHPTFHISLAVISPSHRGQGILPRLFAMVDSYCCEVAGMHRVSICTFEQQMPRMYALLKGEENGWEEVCVREPTGEGPRWSAQSLFVRDAVRAR
jgi:hypothetical protein